LSGMIGFPKMVFLLQTKISRNLILKIDIIPRGAFGTHKRRRLSGLENGDRILLFGELQHLLIREVTMY
jgi:hypothetical protein